jgi:hypothetical protein
MTEWLALCALPVAAWGILSLTLPSQPWEMDFDAGHHGTFFLLLDRFRSTARTVILGSASMVGVAVYREMSSLIVHVGLMAAACAFLFDLWLLLQYNRYLAVKYPAGGQGGASPYTTWRYALTIALGLSAVVYFLLGVGMVVVLA